MKHILIILSFLLLSSPVIGDKQTLPVSGGKGVTLYEWETSSGKVWKYFGDNKIHIKYVGEVENGVPNGLGILYYPDGTDTYLGDYGRRGGIKDFFLRTPEVTPKVTPYTLRNPINWGNRKY